ALQRGLFDDASNVLDAGLAMDRLVVGAHGGGGATGGGRVCVKHDRIPRRDDVHNISAEGGNRMGRRGDGGDDAKGRVFLEGDAVIAAAAVGPEPIDARHQFDDFELFYFVIEPADFCFLEFVAAPRFGVIVGERFDDLL